MPKGSKKRASFFHGIVVVDKPTGMTSQDVVNVVRRAAGTRRVGHTGTLDPLATGLLILMLGEATKLSEYLVGYDKVYEGRMKLGVRSDTYDIEGKMEPGGGAAIPPLDRLREIAAEFVGDIDQVPPPYSAVKLHGKKLYEYAREGETVEVEPRAVTVRAFDILDVRDDTAGFRVHCTSGTYVRSLVHELGAKAGCGAVVAELRRTAVGDFAIDEAVTLDTLRDAKPESFAEFVTPMMDAVPSWSVFHAGERAVMWLRRGQAIPSSLCELDGDSQPPRIGNHVYVCPLGGDAVAIAKVLPAPPGAPPAELRSHVGFWLQPVKLLAPESEG